MCQGYMWNVDWSWNRMTKFPQKDSKLIFKSLADKSQSKCESEKIIYESKSNLKVYIQISTEVNILYDSDKMTDKR